MKESVKVNISGQLFNLDTDAYEHLKKYLDSIERRFQSSPSEAKEILEDIEARIAELLTGKYADPLSQVVNIADIKDITEKLGSADEIDNDEEYNAPEPSEYTSSYSSTKKRFYRNKDNSVLGGVCSGLAAYLNIDPIWVRIIFIFLVFAKLFGLIIYVILWAAVPVARTTKQKLEMRGEDVNIENIKKSVSKEYDKVKEGVKNIPHTKGYKNVEGALTEFVRILGNILLVLVKVIGVIIAVSLVIALIVFVLSIVFGGSVIFPHHFFHEWHWNWYVFDHWPHFTWFGICLFLVIVMPILAIFGKLVRWLFNIPEKNRIAAGVGATIWVVALISLIAISATDMNQNVFRRTFTKEYSFKEDNLRILYIDVNELVDSDDNEHYQIFDYEFIWNDDHDCFYKTPDIEVIYTTDEKVRIEVLRNFICFRSEMDESSESRIVQYDYSLSADKLVFDEYYSCPDYASWRLPNLKVKLYIPEGTQMIYSPEDKGTDIIKELERQQLNSDKSTLKMLDMQGMTD